MTQDRNSKPLRILFVASEIAPFAKTGGLADVCNALPKALAALGHDVRLAMPCYGTIPEALKGRSFGTFGVETEGVAAWGAVRSTFLPGSAVPVYLIEHEHYFHREGIYGVHGHEYPDSLERFSFFCRGVLEAIPQTGWEPDLIHCHDWHTALIPAYLKTALAEHPLWGGVPTVFTIHNLAYQGRHPAALYPKTGLPPEMFTPDFAEYYGEVNLMKLGILLADKVNTVSPRYAKEIRQPQGGFGLDGCFRSRANHLNGILNGVDYSLWNPAADPALIAPYSVDDITGKARCKAVLQQLVRLPRRHVPLFGMVTRIVWDKGVDTLIEALPAIFENDVQIVILGKGDAFYEEPLAAAQDRYPDKLRVLLEYDERKARQIYAGSDFYLMPSHTEPCGLSQMYALAYGSVPIVRETGGLADTVRDISRANIDGGIATGIVFRQETPAALGAAVARALSLFRDTVLLRDVRAAGMRAEFTWERSSEAYIRLFREALAAR